MKSIFVGVSETPRCPGACDPPRSSPRSACPRLLVSPERPSRRVRRVAARQPRAADGRHAVASPIRSEAGTRRPIDLSILERTSSAPSAAPMGLPAKRPSTHWPDVASARPCQAHRCRTRWPCDRDERATSREARQAFRFASRSHLAPAPRRLAASPASRMTTAQPRSTCRSPSAAAWGPAPRCAARRARPRLMRPWRHDASGPAVGVASVLDGRGTPRFAAARASARRLAPDRTATVPAGDG